MNNSMPLAKKTGYEFLWLPSEYGIKGRYFNPITGCPNLRRNEAGKVEGCRTPFEYCSYCKNTRHEKTQYNDGECRYCKTESYCYMANKCNQFPDTHKPEYRFHEDRLDQPMHTKKSSLVAVGTSGDLPGWRSPHHDEILDVLHECTKAPQHFYLFLTQFPEEYGMIDYGFANISNLGIGATVTRKSQFDRIQTIRDIEFDPNYLAKPMKWIILEPIFFTADEAMELDFTGIDWIVCGSLNVRNKALERRWYPESGTIAAIYRQAKSAGCAVFFKNSIADAWYRRRGIEIPREHPKQILEWAREAKAK